MVSLSDYVTARRADNAIKETKMGTLGGISAAFGKRPDPSVRTYEHALRKALLQREVP